MKRIAIIIPILLICKGIPLQGQDATWENGLPDDPGFFPIAVWLQDPADASAYREGGINLYIGLWQGPTEDQLSALRAAGMPVMCSQNATGLDHLEDSIIVGWTQHDEPDNAQPDGSGGYDPCIDPEVIQGIYDEMKANDPTRPVYLNLGQGVSNTDWVGRGTCTGDTWMYPYYIEGCDIVSFDIYPVTSRYDHIRDNLWYVARGIDNLREWSEDSKPVWCWIESTHINSQQKPTPAQVKSEVWMALIHGAKGFGYFCHEWVPEFNSNALLDDPVMFPAVTAINSRIHELAPVLNSPDTRDRVTVTSDNSDVPIDILVKHFRDTLYVFAVAMRDGTTSGTFSVEGIRDDEVTVIGEARKIEVTDDGFEDAFSGYEVHLYKMEYLNTGVESIPPESVRIYPNPGSDYVTIRVEKSIQHCALINLSGQVTPIQGIAGNRIDISNCSPGIYVLHGWTDNDSFQQKIVIEN
ncbi:MAG: T9SS type A sorting domain-containing protein [Bacteroidales bacterium]